MHRQFQMHPEKKLASGNLKVVVGNTIHIPKEHAKPTPYKSHSEHTPLTQALLARTQ